MVEDCDLELDNQGKVHAPDDVENVYQLPGAILSNCSARSKASTGQ